MKKRGLLFAALYVLSWALWGQELPVTTSGTGASERSSGSSTQPEQNSTPPDSNSPNSTPESETLSELLDAQMRDLLNLDETLRQAQEQSRALSSGNAELMRLLELSRQRTSALDRSLEQFGERLQKANEDLAAIYGEMDAARRGAVVGFTLGAVGFGVGVPLVVEGARTGSGSLAGAGIGVAVGAGAVWAAGHWLFGWW